ncbi:bacteriocin [Flavobacterium muglaense]|uniref:Bacteriocin n=1 Tax=Flavobacterium muglaense TaxID=2764716 RepID=A0A923MY23_9FLAO|nr:bacteriocin [Flavobacterium muglaense]MBC5837287.1 bacteriocin [Flavobacterium muglaense]MBC5843789.1 bacteriocin [Flavobacterium muglaense]
MNVENLNLVELNVQEATEVDGGNPYVGWLLSAAAGSFLYGIVEDWDGNVEAFNAAYNKGRK